jgi:hypothetical protein
MEFRRLAKASSVAAQCSFSGYLLILFVGLEIKERSKKEALVRSTEQN